MKLDPFRWISDRSIRHPWLALLVMLLLTVAMSTGLKNLEVDPDVLRDLPDDMPEKVLYDRVGELFPSKEMIFVGLEHPQLWTPGTLRQVEQLTRAVEELPVVQQVISPTNATVVVGTDMGMEIRDAADPFPASDAEAEEFRDFLTEQASLSGLVVSEDGAVAAMMIFLEANLQTTEAKAAGQVLETLDTTLASIAEQPETTALTMYPAGRPVTTWVSSKTIGKETGMLTSSALVLMIVLLGALFMNFRGVFLPIGVVVGATLWTMGAMGWVGLAMTHSTEALPIMLIAIGVADGVHIVQAFMVRVRSMDREAAVVATMDDLRWPVIMTSVTSAAGFLALNTSGVRSIMILGGLTAFGIVVALLFSLSFVPALLVLLPTPKHSRVKRPSPEASLLQRLLMAWGDWLVRHKSLATAGILALVGLSIWGATQVQVETSVNENFPEDNPIRIAGEFFDVHFAGVTNLQVVFEGEPGTVKDPAFLALMQEFQTWAEAQDQVGGSSSIVPMLTSMNRVMHAGDPAYERLPHASETEHGVDYQLDEEGREIEVPITRTVSGDEVISGYFSLLEMSGKPGDLANFVTDDYGSAKVTVFLKSDRKKDLDRVVAGVRGWLDEHQAHAQVEMTGMAVLMLAVNDLITKGQSISILVSLLLVFALTALQFRSAGLGLVNTLPLFVALFFNFGLMGLFGLDINLMTMGVASMAIGVGVDYGIHFVHRYREDFARAGEPVTALRHTMGEAGVAIFMNALAVAGGFLVLLLASFNGVRTMGLLISLIMAFSALGALTILPLIFTGLRPKAAERLGKGAILTLTLLVLLPALAPRALAAEGDGRAYMESVLNRSSFQDMQGTSTLTITSASGSTKVRSFKMASRDNDQGENDMILYMQEPADMRGNAFLVLGRAETEDERWIYIPALHRANRIVGSGRKGNFMSSDFTYDDIGSPDIDEWTWTLGPRTELDGHPCQEVIATPADDRILKDTGLSEVHWFIDSELKTTRKAEFYDRQGALTRRMEVQKIELFGEVPFATDMLMTDLASGRTSRMTMSDLKVDAGVDPAWFTKRALQNGF
jgi:predicted RND superfamily exporter protein